MIKDEAGLAIANEVGKTIQVGNQGGTALRHCFKRRESKGFASFSQRGIDKQTGRPKSLFEANLVEDWTSEFDLGSGAGRRALEFREILASSSAKFRLGWTDNHQFPILKSSGRSPNEGIDQNMHTFFRVHPPHIKHRFRSIRNGRWR